MKRQYSLRGRSAMTLIELLIVMAVIALLASIVIPSIGLIRSSADATLAVSNIRTIGQTNLLFGVDFNGRINGVGDWRPPNEGEQGIVFRIAPYLVGKAVGSMTWDEVWPVIRQYRDPRIPPENTWGPETDQFSWTFNDIFSIPSGVGPISEAPFRRMNEFEETSQILYATSGVYTFTPEMLTNPEFLEMPEEGWRVGFYVAHRGRIPAVFLDGHAALLRFPDQIPAWPN
jgi:prepilin-type N-terminal cleavage/methylation domain-containing protein/prepilin-type processing-associated H-X9-DG protein